jgi:hypothetical protein
MVIRTHVVALQRMLDHLNFTKGELTTLGRQLRETTALVRSHDGEYAHWVQSLADQCDHDLRTLADELESLANRFSVFEQCKQSRDPPDHSCE